MGRRKLGLSVLVLAFLSPPVCAVAFQGIGTVSGHTNIGLAISADGSTVAGLAFKPGGYSAFRWTKDAGIVLLGTSEFATDQANGVSGDGTEVVGLDAGGYGGFIWTASGIQHLPFRPWDISADGLVIVGGLPDGHAVYWTAGSGLQTLPGAAGARHFGHAYAVSLDGHVIVGKAATGPIGGDDVVEAVAWFDGSTPISLGAGHDSEAYAASETGSVIVGRYLSRSQYRAFRWSLSSGLQALPEPSSGTTYMSALAVSGDGSRVVGEYQQEGTSGPVAFVWDAEHGTRPVSVLLAGVPQANGWKLLAAHGISANGRFLTGDGVNPSGVRESWIASISPGPELWGLTLSNSTVPGCKTVTGTVTLSSPATGAGIIVSLSDTLSAAVTPATVTIAAGLTSGKFSIRTSTVASVQTGQVSASLNGSALHAGLTVRPVGLASLKLSPTTVVGGHDGTGTATLECAAGPGPITVDLSSSKPAVAFPVATSVVVPQGLKSAKFTVATNPVLSKTYAMVTGTASTTTKTRTLNVVPAAVLSPSSIKFGTVAVGSSSPALNATLTNKGTLPFTVGSIALTGTYASWYAQANNCPASLAPGTSCTISVTFTPQAAASKSAKLTIATSATNTPLSVSLSGTGF